MENKLKKIRECETLEDLKSLEIGEVVYDIGGRGGNLGYYGADVAEYVGCTEEDLPAKYGCYCNYLGGGIRGAVAPSGYNKSVEKEAAELLDALAEACKAVYIAEECGLNNELYEDGEPNWDALATQTARKAGVVSAY